VVDGSEEGPALIYGGGSTSMPRIMVAKPLSERTLGGGVEHRAAAMPSRCLGTGRIVERRDERG
jgi:hypothetical protein